MGCGTEVTGKMPVPLCLPGWEGVVEVVCRGIDKAGTALLRWVGAGGLGHWGHGLDACATLLAAGGGGARMVAS